MPRNSSGIYSLPAGNPVVINTTIDPAWANTTLGDLSSEIGNSLDRSGRGGMLAPLRMLDGIVSAPALSFTNEPSTGIWRSGPGVLTLSVLGANIGSFTSAGWLGQSPNIPPVAANEYTPTVVGSTNLTATSSVGTWKYLRIGNYAVMAGAFSGATTGGVGVASSINLSLPFGSTLSTTFDVVGVANTNYFPSGGPTNIIVAAGNVGASGAGNMSVTWNATASSGGGSQSYAVVAMYKIV